MKSNGYKFLVLDSRIPKLNSKLRSGFAIVTT